MIPEHATTESSSETSEDVQLIKKSALSTDAIRKYIFFILREIEKVPEESIQQMLLQTGNIPVENTQNVLQSLKENKVLISSYQDERRTVVKISEGFSRVFDKFEKMINRISQPSLHNK